MYVIGCLALGPKKNPDFAFFAYVFPCIKSLQDGTITAPNFFWMKLGPIRASLCTWVGHLGHWIRLERTKRLKTADNVPYIPVPT